jgi:hypothetical protein
MNHSFFTVVGVFVAGVAVTAPAVAQMNRATFESLVVPMYPQNFPEYRNQNVEFFWVDPMNTVWASNNTYGRVLTADSSQSNNPDNVWYAKIAATEPNMYVTVAPFWDAPIAPPGPRPSDGRWADGCGHSHFGYAAFNRIWIFNGSQWAVYITLRASEGRIGRRYEWINGAWQQSTAQRSDLPCFVTSDPDPSGFYAPYIWKNNIQNLDPIQFLYYQNGSTFIQVDELTVAVQGATHGGGDCGYFLCFPQVGLVAFRSR